MSKLKSIYRDFTCNDLSVEQVGQTITLSGWILSKRDHGGVLFVDLRDNYGVTQIVFSGEVADKIQKLKVESVIKVNGEVVKREGDLVNKKIPTGEVEIQCKDVEILSEAKVLPFLIAEDDNAPEKTRLAHRFLELRRDKLHNNILKRNQIISKSREIMNSLGFSEFNTPILTSSSPEGARDFIVPSRLHPGKFFALPQAPQQFKQLLMVSGFDRYFQIAPCFRDEDSRADRSPGEFYQIDIEMSFVEQDDVLEVNEKLTKELFSSFSDKKIAEKFPRFNHDEVMLRYGSDKPDLRNPLEIIDITPGFEKTEFRVFQNVLKDNGKVRAITFPVDEIPSRKVLDEIINFFTKLTGQGLGTLIVERDSYKGSIHKFISQEEVDYLKKETNSDGNFLVFLAAGQDKQILPWLGRLRDKLGTTFDLINDDEWKFLWVVNFPFFEEDEETGKIEFGHNPFSMPQGGMEALENKDPLEISAYQYDLVCNGYELGSGAIRNHNPDIMYKAFEIAGYGKEVVNDKFGGMISAFQFGAPPHGGFAHGIERIIMLLCGEEAIRDIIPFPLAQTAEDLMMKAPSDISEKQLKEVHIALDLPEDLELKE
ncbi:UNVERIFIED_CONTAM: hypothetical protein GTU68_052474 [Idotea baltica]|nr:hypothetical protein [Idotea baltica]